MPISARRVVPWMLRFALAAVLVAGFAGEASADIYSGTLTFQGLPSANITITVTPGAGATYTTTLFGRQFGFRSARSLRERLLRERQPH